MNEKQQLFLAVVRLVAQGNLDPTYVTVRVVYVSSQKDRPTQTLKYTMGDLLKSKDLNLYLNNLQGISIKWNKKKPITYLSVRIEEDG